MKALFRLSLFCCLLLMAANAARAQYGLVCGNPKDKGCIPQYDGFRPQDLAFQTYRAKLGTGTTHESTEFYAVILESVRADKNRAGRCNYVSEKRRLAAQRMFPVNKVFASRNTCSGAIVLYQNVNNDHNFLAVYAGETEAEALAVLERARRRYPQANLRKMRVVLDFADQ